MEAEPAMQWLELSLTHAQPWIELGFEAALGVLLGLALHSLLYRIARRIASGFVVAHTLVSFGRRPVQLLLPLLMVHIAASDAPASMFLINPLRHLLTIALLATLTYLCIRLIKGVGAAVIGMHPTDIADNLRARSVHTQTRVLSRSVMTLAGLIGVASILMTFPGIRQIGASLLASAGVAGLIALAQPIRIDDVLIIEGEWGRVEEITGSYVVMRLWDDRRQIVPLAWFIEHPLQNWTRSSSHLLGTVFLWVDYAMPLEPLRRELERICHAAPEWDGRLCLLQVTETSDRAMQLRALVSARDASLGWDLRCRVREALLVFIQGAYADDLPRLRGSFEHFADDGRAAPASGGATG